MTRLPPFVRTCPKEAEAAVSTTASVEPSLDTSERAGGLRSVAVPAAVLSLIVAIVYCLSPVVLNGDSYLLLPTATSIVHERNLDLDEYQHLPAIARHGANREINGSHYNEFPWVGALFFVPLVVAIDLAHAAGVGPGMDALIERDQMGGLQLLVASFVTAAVAGVVTLLTFERLLTARRPRLVALVVGALFAFGTAAWSTTSRALWQHAPSMLFLSLALLVGSVLDRPAPNGPRTPALSFLLGAFVVLAYTVRPTNAIALLGFTVWMVALHRRQLMAYLGGGAVVLVPWLAVNVATYKHLLTAYNEGNRLGLHDAFGEALLANLISPARGLLIFSPLVVLALVGVLTRVVGRGGRRGLDGIEWLAIVVVVAHWLAISTFKDQWWAGHSFGPRFFSDALPFLLVLCLPAADLLDSADLRTPTRRGGVAVVAVLAAWSIAINLEGAVMRASSCWNVDPRNVQFHPDRVWDWSDAQFTRGYRRLLEDGPRASILAVCPTTETAAAH